MSDPVITTCDEAAASGWERSKVLLSLIERHPDCTSRDLWRAVFPFWRCSEAEVRRRVRSLEDTGAVVGARKHGGRVTLRASRQPPSRALHLIPRLFNGIWCYADDSCGAVWWPARDAGTKSELHESYVRGEGRWAT